MASFSQICLQPARPVSLEPPARLAKLLSIPAQTFQVQPASVGKEQEKLIFRAVEDADLIPKAQRGDVEAFNLLISRWEKRVFNYLLRILQNREDALDLSQDVFLKAYQNLRKLEDPNRFPAWLFRNRHNEAFSLSASASRKGSRRANSIPANRFQ